MKIRQVITLKSAVLLGLVLTLTMGCEREVSDEAVLATFPTTGDIFVDNPVGLTTDFFISFDPAGGANTEGFGTDENEVYEGSSSIRIDVPVPTDPNGGFIGGIFKDNGEGRNLTQYDALTFWAKGSITGTIGEVGFGTDFEEDKFPVSIANVQLSTDWRKYTIPIPDPSKLVQEKGMFLFSAGTQSTNGVGFTFWIDELRFETLGTVAQPRPRIFNGVDLVENVFTGSTIQVNGLTYTANLASGMNQTVNASPNYFEFNSSDPSVATVNSQGQITVVGEGTTTISATLGNVTAEGSIQITSAGSFPTAPVPTRPAANVISVFSNAYTNVVEPNFTPGFGGSSTVTNVFPINGDDVADYTNNNFTGIMFDDSPINGSAMQFLHVDIFAPEASTSIEFQIRDIGANQTINTNENNGFPTDDDADYRFTASGLNPGAWNSVEIPLAGNIATQKNNLGAIILVGGPDFILDNIYFYTN